MSAELGTRATFGEPDLLHRSMNPTVGIPIRLTAQRSFGKPAAGPRESSSSCCRGRPMN